jgi:hypothetical protein
MGEAGFLGISVVGNAIGIAGSPTNREDSGTS